MCVRTANSTRMGRWPSCPSHTAHFIEENVKENLEETKKEGRRRPGGAWQECHQKPARPQSSAVGPCTMSRNPLPAPVMLPGCPEWHHGPALLSIVRTMWRLCRTARRKCKGWNF